MDDIEQLSSTLEHISQLYAERFTIERDATWFILKLQEEVGELTQAYLMYSGQARTKGKSPKDIEADFRREVADVFCQTLLLAKYYGIDLKHEVEQKWLRWNKA